MPERAKSTIHRFKLVSEKDGQRFERETPIEEAITEARNFCNRFLKASARLQFDLDNENMERHVAPRLRRRTSCE